MVHKHKAIIIEHTWQGNVVPIHYVILNVAYMYWLWSDVRRPPMFAGHIILHFFPWKTTNIFIYYQQIYHL